MTGISQIQKDTEAIGRDIAKLEGKPDAAALEMVLKRIEFTLKATEIAIKAEAREMVRSRHGQLMHEQGRLIQATNLAYAEVGDLEKTLEAHGKGQDAVPQGFTAEELRDRVADLRAQIAQADAKDQELRARMKELEDLLALEVVPPQGDSLFTRERDALIALRERAEALRGR